MPCGRKVGVTSASPFDRHRPPSATMARRKEAEVCDGARRCHDLNRIVVWIGWCAKPKFPKVRVPSVVLELSVINRFNFGKTRVTHPKMSPRHKRLHWKQTADWLWAAVSCTPNHLFRRLLHYPYSADDDANNGCSCVFDCEYDKENIQSNETNGGRRVYSATTHQRHHCAIALCQHAPMFQHHLVLRFAAAELHWWSFLKSSRKCQGGTLSSSTL